MLVLYIVCNRKKKVIIIANMILKKTYQEMVYCSGSNSTSHMKTKGFCFQLPLINTRRESAKMKFKSSQNCRRVI